MTGPELFVTVLVALIAASPPTLMAFVVWKTAEKKLGDIHVIVNDQMTREKAKRLDDLRSQRVVLRRIIGNDATDTETEILGQVERQIEQLAREIQGRDRVAAGLATSGEES